jgi:hypothetical protein
MPTYADICRRMLTYADVCKQHRAGPLSMFKALVQKWGPSSDRQLSVKDVAEKVYMCPKNVCPKNGGPPLTANFMCPHTPILLSVRILLYCYACTPILLSVSAYCYTAICLTANFMCPQTPILLSVCAYWYMCLHTAVLLCVSAYCYMLL